MSPQSKRFFLWFVIIFLVIFMVLISISLIHNFNKPKLISLPSRELRGIWMSRFDYTQPFKTHDPDSMKAYISDSFRKLKAANFNVVFFQVRGNGDALYTSKYEPWSAFLSGELGKNPGWDPLAFAVEAAHQNGLELHAWINTFPAWRGTTPPPITRPLQPYRAHPDWLVCDDTGQPMPLSEHYVSFSPGIPAVRDYIIKVVSDIVSRYDIDGLHFDYIRYPEGSQAHGYSHDPISRARFKSPDGNPLNLNWADWQREQVTEFIAKAYDRITTIKPWVKVSVAAIGSYQSTEWNGYHSVFQDVRRWSEIGKIDLLIPMTYYARNQSEYSFPKVIKDWKSKISRERPLLPGLGAFNLEWKEIIAEIHDVRNNQFPGMVFFALSSLDDENFNSLQTTEFKFPAIIPAFSWKDSIPPATPDNFSIDKTDSKIVEFTWQVTAIPLDKDVCKRFIIYRSVNLPIDLTKGENIFAIIPGTETSYKTEMKLLDRRYSYTITSLDDAENESTPLSPIRLE
ncbi:MAG: family 10 glycosylhydrolase [Candidatus Neomarinimicrobiota bacterium]